ncbi:MAG: hypothetical protein R2753_04155 [Chitinophagales bacterium]
MSIKSAWKGILFFCFLFGFTNGFAQFNGKHTYIAKLKEEVGVVDIKVGDYVLFSIRPDDEFIYDTFGKQAWMPNGKFGKIDEEMVERIPNSKYFKFDHSLDFFKLHEDNELVKAAKAKGINYQEMLNSSIAGNTDQLQQMFLLMNLLNGTAGELHKAMMFRVFSRYDDKNFATFLDEQQEDLKKMICKFLVKPSTLWPIEDEYAYYKLFYPKTYTIIMKYKDL